MRTGSWRPRDEAGDVLTPVEQAAIDDHRAARDLAGKDHVGDSERGIAGIREVPTGEHRVEAIHLVGMDAGGHTEIDRTALRGGARIEDRFPLARDQDLHPGQRRGHANAVRGRRLRSVGDAQSSRQHQEVATQLPPGDRGRSRHGDHDLHDQHTLGLTTRHVNDQPVAVHRK